MSGEACFECAQSGPNRFRLSESRRTVTLEEHVPRSAKPLEQTRLLTLPEVAGFLNVSPRTVRRLVASRRLRCVRLGRVLRFQPADLFRFVEARKE